MRARAGFGLALGVALGGLLLGTVLGEAAEPEMKNLPETAGRDAPPADTAPAHAPEGVAVYGLATYPDRYAPPFPDEEITDWAPDYPAWTYSDFGDELLGAFPDDRAAPPESEPLPHEPRGDGSLPALY